MSEARGLILSHFYFVYKHFHTGGVYLSYLCAHGLIWGILKTRQRPVYVIW